MMHHSVLKAIGFICLSLTMLGSSVSAADWPHWRGAARSGHSVEDSGWESGAWSSLPTMWSMGVGVGGCSMVVFKDRLYTLGFDQGQDVLLCLDAKTGNPVWRQSYPSREYGRFARGDQQFFRGPLATPEIDVATGWLYTLSVDGELQCRDGNANGKRVWGLNLYDQFGVPQRPQVTRRGGSHRDYGYICAPMIYRDQVIVEVGDPKQGNLMGFDKRTGKLLWQSENKDPAGHTGGMSPITVDGIPCVAVLTALNLVVTRLDSGQEGKMVAKHPWITDFINNIPTPAVSGQDVVVTSRYNRMAMARLHVTRSGFRKVWEQPMASGVCSPVIDDGKMYWANRGLHCVDFATGKLIWKGDRFRDAASCILTSDKRLIVWADQGDLALIEGANRSAGKYVELASRKGVLRDTAWPHVVLAGQRLYCKDRGGQIKCLALEKGAIAPLPITMAKKSSVNAKPFTSTKPFHLVNWLSDDPALVLGWKAGGGKRNLKGSLLKDGRCSFEARGNADFGPDREMALSRGAYLLKGGDELHRAFQKANQFTLEVILSSGNASQTGPARIVSFSEDAYRRNFTLGQEGSQFVLRLRTTQTGENGMRPEIRFGQIKVGVQTHLLLTYREGELTCYQNGMTVFERKGHVKGSLANWNPQHFLIGDEWNGDRQWSGRVFGVALYNRFVDAKEVSERFAAISE